jgi:hypothetical protein
MKTLALILIIAAAAPADQKYFPGQAGNDNIEIRAEMWIDAAQIKEAVGAELGEGYVVARATITNKTGEAMRVNPSDFTTVSRKDGDRGDALAPGQLAGGSALVLKTNHAGREWAQQTNSPGWLGVSGTKTEKPKDGTLLATLTTKQFPDQDLKPNESASGLLYFSIQTKKLKTKDLALLYKGPGGHLSVEFK